MGVKIYDILIQHTVLGSDWILCDHYRVVRLSLVFSTHTQHTCVTVVLFYNVCVYY